MGAFVDFGAMSLEQLDREIAAWRQLAYNAGQLKKASGVFRGLRMMDIAIAVRRRKAVEQSEQSA